MFKQHASESVTYRLGGAAVVLQASLGASDFAVTDANGIMMEVKSVDFIVRRADLVLNGVAVEPVDGARIYTTVNGVQQAFAVMSIAGAPCFKDCDENRFDIRIHTKRVSAMLEAVTVVAASFEAENPNSPGDTCRIYIEFSVNPLSIEDPGILSILDGRIDGGDVWVAATEYEGAGAFIVPIPRTAATVNDAQTNNQFPWRITSNTGAVFPGGVLTAPQSGVAEEL